MVEISWKLWGCEKHAPSSVLRKFTQAWGEREKAHRKDTRTEGNHEICVLETKASVIIEQRVIETPLQQTSQRGKAISLTAEFLGTLEGRFA